ncbi:MAG: S9 family peptidase [Thermoanaerobaculia bacterium]|nr:S9 family peptidase [Thermoanaerobaculia bacterium]
MEGKGDVISTQTRVVLGLAGILAMSAVDLPAADSVAPRPTSAREVAHPRVLHGDSFDDRWFWLRERENPEVLAHLAAENAYAEAMTAASRPLADQLYGELVGRLIEDDEGVPARRGDWLYFWRLSKGLQHRVWLRRPAAGGPEQTLVDLNELGRGEKFIALGAFEVSDDGKQLAYSLDRVGFRQYTLYVRDLVRNVTREESVPEVTSVAWAADGRSLFYVVEDDAKRPHRLWRWALDSGERTLVHEEGDERFGVSVERSRSGAWIFATSASHTASEVRLIDPGAPAATPRLVAPRRAGHEYYLEHSGERLFVRSNRAGGNFALFETRAADPAETGWKVVRSHDPQAMLEEVDAFARHLVLSERAGGLMRFRVLDLASGGDHLVTLPEVAYVARGAENEVFDTDRFRYHYESPKTPASVFDYRIADRTSELLKRDVIPGFDPAVWELSRIEAPAKDGVRVPLTVVHRRGLVPDGTHRALLRGYGSYGYAYPTGFDTNAVSLLERGFVLATAHVRGGGELGKAWHEQGRMAAKMNTFTDFIACAEELVRRGYTSPARLAITGGSAGGLLMGAVTNLRPDLFGVVLSYVPFVDVINTMLDTSLPLTVGEFEEWGNPAVEEQYRWMIAYSPYENLAVKAYPAMLVRTSFHDSQVMYWEPAKYVARLRSLKTDGNPLLFRINLDAGGHGGFAGRYDRLRDTAADYAFLLTTLP